MRVMRKPAPPHGAVAEIMAREFDEQPFGSSGEQAAPPSEPAPPAPAPVQILPPWSESPGRPWKPRSYSPPYSPQESVGQAGILVR
jgi:hypothetical protein